MKVVILSEGGKKIGFGHLTRCIGLSQCIVSENPKADVEFIINDDAAAEKLLKLNQFKAQRRDWQSSVDKAVDAVKNADFVVMDSYLSGKEIYDAVSDKLAGRILMIDDYQRIDYPKGILLGPSVYSDRLDYQKQTDRTYLLGKEYIVLRQEFWDINPRSISDNITDILVTFGGIQRPEFIKYAFDQFISEYDQNFHIVLSESNVDPEDLPERIKVYRGLTASEMKDLMLQADLCISGGGQTLYELARCGTPTVTVCFADNQQGNVETLSELKFIEYVGDYNQDGLWEKVHEAVKNLGDAAVRKERSAKGQVLVDGKGPKRIVEHISKVMQDENYIKSSN